MKIAGDAITLMSIAVVSVLIGAGLGFVQTQLAMSAHTFTGRASYAAGSAYIGGIAGAVAGPLVYYAVVRRRLSVEQVFLLISLVALPGILSAAGFAWVAGEGWPSIVVTGAALIIVPIAFRALCGRE
jgi:prolipoprotein diacylglyceryltransferase